jgi:hypothetical protein
MVEERIGQYQGPGDAPDRTVEPEFPHERQSGHASGVQDARGDQDADSDREIEPGTRLLHA